MAKASEDVDVPEGCTIWQENGEWACFVDGLRAPVRGTKKKCVTFWLAKSRFNTMRPWGAPFIDAKDVPTMAKTNKDKARELLREHRFWVDVQQCVTDEETGLCQLELEGSFSEFNLKWLTALATLFGTEDLEVSSLEDRATITINGATLG